MTKVLVTCKQMQEFLAEENPELELEFVCPELSGQYFTSHQMIQLAKDIPIVIAGDDVLDREFFESSPSLKILVRWGVGTDNVDFESAKDAGVPIYNTPGVFNNEVAELAFCYVLMLARNVLEVHLGVSRGGWPKLKGSSLRGKGLGILGYGGIGRALGNLGLASGMKIHVLDPYVQQDLHTACFHDNLTSLLKHTEYLVLTAPLTASTHHIINDHIFTELDNPIKLINVSRGPLVDESSVIRALKNGKLSGFASDVFEVEPLPSESLLRNREGVILGSHNGSNTIEGVARASQECLRIIRENYP